MKTYNLLPLMCVIAILFSCKTSKDCDSDIEIMKYELEKVVNKQNNNFKYVFEAKQNNYLKTVIFKNKMIGQQVTLAENDTILLLGYYAESSTNNKAIEFFKSEIVKQDKILSYQVRDISGKIIKKEDFEGPDLDHQSPPPGNHESIDDCLDEYFCVTQSIQCEANRTCETKFYGIICCLNDGSCVAIDFIFPPTNPRCLIQLLPIDLPLIISQVKF